MSKVVVFNQIGGAEVLNIQEMQVCAPDANEVQIRVRAIGINRAEVMYRTGQYIYQPNFPARLGYEAAGVIESVGDNVREFAPAITLASSRHSAFINMECMVKSLMPRSRGRKASTKSKLYRGCCQLDDVCDSFRCAG